MTSQQQMQGRGANSFQLVEGINNRACDEKLSWKTSQQQQQLHPGTMVRSSAEERRQSSIVGSSSSTEFPPQSSLESNLPGSTKTSWKGHEFGEQAHPQVDTLYRGVDASSSTPPSSNQLPLHNNIEGINPVNNPNNIYSNIGHSLNAREHQGLVPDQSWTQPNNNNRTTRSETSHAGIAPVRTEQGIRDRSIISHTTESGQGRIHLNQPQHLVSNPSLSILTHPTPTTAHAATAAEIALGIIPDYNLRVDNRNQSAMANDNRNRYWMAQQASANTNDKQGRSPSSAVFESLSEVKTKADEENSSRTSETGAATSTGRMTPPDELLYNDAAEHPRIAMIGTPSTVSTAPSTDDASLGTEYKLDESNLPYLLQPSVHQRSNSWGDEGLLPGFSLQDLNNYSQNDRRNPLMAATTAGGIHQQFQPRPRQPWGANKPNQLVASFRQDPNKTPSESPSSGAHNNRHPRGGDHWHPTATHQQQQQRQGSGDMQIQYPAQLNRGMKSPRQNSSEYHEYSRQTGGYQPQPNQQQMGSKGINSLGHHAGGHGAMTPASTPPRNPRKAGQANNNRLTPTGNPNTSSPHQPGPNPQRSSSEILKTLLRKKACLYEPDTSRAVALVTWLVGRELALEYGFFSRQQLQSGVHTCVADKIESGTITRTKVNRCMQIILNSCFHYIIPRSDGTEEKGDSFRVGFAHTVKNDVFLLNHLSHPWNDLTVKREAVIQASLNETDEHSQGTPRAATASTPKSSPKLGSINHSSPGRDSNDTAELVEAKRAVLLCFNENVRSAEDVFRCHNEFIRDTANAAHLQLTAQEWRTFFGREAARSPYLWGNVGVPPQAEEETNHPKQQDVFGQMSLDESGKFRTTWCTKRYDHDHDLCGFAHVEVNGGWLRRNPSVFAYSAQMCSYITASGENPSGTGNFVINECPKGVYCECAHSMEEVVYHPSQYKSKVCSSLYSRAGCCHLGDVCPNLHPSDAPHVAKKHSEGRPHNVRHQRKNDQLNTSAKNVHVPPAGSPVIYANPAPFSSFERQLAMPGLQNLYRRHSAVVRALVRTSGKCNCSYNCFGDEWGIANGPSYSPKSRPGLPPSPRS